MPTRAVGERHGHLVAYRQVHENTDCKAASCCNARRLAERPSYSCSGLRQSIGKCSRDTWHSFFQCSRRLTHRPNGPPRSCASLCPPHFALRWPLTYDLGRQTSKPKGSVTFSFLHPRCNVAALSITAAPTPKQLAAFNPLPKPETPYEYSLSLLRRYARSFSVTWKTPTFPPSG